MAIFGCLHTNNDALGIDRVHDSIAAADHHGAGIASRDLFHAGSDQRCCRAEQRHGLALHVRPHEGPVGVVVFEEWDERCRHRNQLLRRYVDVVHFVSMLQHEVAGLPDVHQFMREMAVFIHFHVRLRDQVFVLFPGGQVERVGYELRAFLFLILERFVLLLNRFALDMIANFELRITGADDGDVIHNAPVLHLTIRALDKPKLVDAGIAAQRGNQSDVWTFRRFDGANAAVVRGMHVADFESSALARKTAGSKGRQTALMGNFRKRIRLIHKLRQLR